MNKLVDKALSLSSILKAYWPRVSLTWLLTLVETALTVLIPLFIGYAIDGLIEGETQPLVKLACIMGLLIFTGVCRRIYDTRAYGNIKIDLSEELIKRSSGLSTSNKNARMEMGRELADFLEEHVPELMNASIQLVLSVLILLSFHPNLSISALIAGVGTLLIYALFHGKFFRLNSDLNHLKESQVDYLERQNHSETHHFLVQLKRAEVRISDSESYLYGAIFALLLGFIVFNLWYSVSTINVSVGAIFSIISYSWEFVESTVMLPATLQYWSRLSEIIQRINTTND